MLILCCDTATDYAVFALCDETGALAASVAVEHRRNLSAQFFASIDIVLADAGCVCDDIDAFAVGIGPGSFTGVRIAVTSLRTLAQVTQKPIVGICTLDIYAYVRDDPEKSVSVAALLPSRRNELYAGFYPAHGRPRVLFAAQHATVLERLAAFGDGESVIVRGPESARPDGLTIPYEGIVAPPAESFGRLAALAIARGETHDPLSLNPLYVVAPAINQHLNPAETARLRHIDSEHL